MEIIDSHAHLEFAQFDEDRAAMLDRARAAGVSTVLAIGSGTSPEERLDAAIPFAEQHDWIYATIGIHPHDAKAATDEHFQRLEELTHHPRVIAMGEMGLDYYYDHSPRDVQQQVFRRQLASGARREAAGRDPLPRRVARLPGDPRKRLETQPAWAAFSTASRPRSTKRAAAWT